MTDHLLISAERLSGIQIEDAELQKPDPDRVAKAVRGYPNRRPTLPLIPELVELPGWFSLQGGESSDS